MLPAELVEAAGHDLPELAEAPGQLARPLDAAVGDAQVARTAAEERGHDAPRRAAGAEDQDVRFLERHVEIAGEIGQQPDAVGVVAVEAAVGGDDDGVDGAGEVGAVRQLVDELARSSPCAAR